MRSIPPLSTADTSQPRRPRLIADPQQRRIADQFEQSLDDLGQIMRQRHQRLRLRLTCFRNRDYDRVLVDVQTNEPQLTRRTSPPVCGSV